MSTQRKIQFGIFLPIANGGWIVSRNAPVIDGSFGLNKRATLLAEELGLDFVLSMMKWRGFGGPPHHWGTAQEGLRLVSAPVQVKSRSKLSVTVSHPLYNTTGFGQMG